MRRRWIAAVATVAVVATGAVVAAPRWTAHPAAATDIVEIHAAHGTSYVPALQGKRPMFILALGSDARPGQPVERERADSIHIIGVNFRTHRATILGFPRDSWVHIPGYYTTKINTAMTLGGPPLMVKTIESLTGIHIDFWMLTTFPGLIGMVNGIGGLDVVVPAPMHDKYSGADFTAGEHHFDGQAALAFSRDRHDVDGGDLGRSANQGRLFLSALAGLRKNFGKDPSRLLTWISVGWRNVHTDLPLATLFDLALTATQVDPAHVNNLVVPAIIGQVGAASVVFITSAASAYYADMRKDGVIG